MMRLRRAGGKADAVRHSEIYVDAKKWWNPGWVTILVQQLRWRTLSLLACLAASPSPSRAQRDQRSPRVRRAGAGDSVAPGPYPSRGACSSLPLLRRPESAAPSARSRRSARRTDAPSTTIVPPVRSGRPFSSRFAADAEMRIWTLLTLRSPPITHTAPPMAMRRPPSPGGS